MTASRLGPTVAVVSALLTACAAATPSPSVAPSTSSAPSEAAAPSATPVSAVPMCAGVFDTTAGRVAMTVGNLSRSLGIGTVNADGSDFRQVVEPDPQRDQPHNGTEAPRWTPDGRILFDSNRAGGPDDWHIFIVDADGGEPIQLTGGTDGGEYNAVMAPDSSTMVYAKVLATPGGPGPYGGGGIFASNPDGSNERQLAAVPPGVSPEFPEGAEDEWPDISPDGRWVAFTRAHSSEGGLFIMNIDGSGLRRLINYDMQPERPRWSPDGTLIVFHTNSERFETESANVWVVAPDGSGLRQLTHESVPGQAWAPDWSPDGKHIVFVHTTTSRSTALDVIGLDGSTTCVLYQGGSTPAGWDPDWGPPRATP